MANSWISEVYGGLEAPWSAHQRARRTLESIMLGVNGNSGTAGDIGPYRMTQSSALPVKTEH